MASDPTIYSRLPSIYHGRLGSIFDDTFPQERFATCASCVSCQHQGSPYLTTKCCTYQPGLPNFLAGGILVDAATAVGRERLLAVISGGRGLSPLGVRQAGDRVGAPPSLSPTRIPSRAEAEAMRCAFFAEGACTIWNHREHLCSSFFCHSVGGRAGQRFWQLLDQYLQRAERELAKFALTQLGWRAGDLTLNDTVAWNGWQSRPSELYIECHRVIGALNRDHVRAVLGDEGQRLEDALSSALVAFRLNRAPERLVAVVPLRFAAVSDTDVEMHGADGVARIPRLTARFVGQFDGVRTTVDVVRQAAAVEVEVANHIAPLRRAGVLQPEETSAAANE